MFARATRALSVYQEYLALESGLPGFTPDFTSPALLRMPFSHFAYAYGPITLYGDAFQRLLLGSMILNRVLQPQRVNSLVWADPRSLAATDGISCDFFSSGY